MGSPDTRVDRPADTGRAGKRSGRPHIGQAETSFPSSKLLACFRMWSRAVSRSSHVNGSRGTHGDGDTAIEFAGEPPGLGGDVSFADAAPDHF